MNKIINYSLVSGQEGGAIYASQESGILPISFSLTSCLFEGNQGLRPYNVTDPVASIRGGGGALFLLYSR